MEAAVKEFDLFAQHNPDCLDCNVLSANMIAAAYVQQGALQEALSVLDHALRFVRNPAVRKLLQENQACLQEILLQVAGEFSKK